jgi:hypothetical protein
MNTSKHLRISSVNKAIAHLGVELVKGEGYFYFVTSDGVPVDGKSVYVYRLNHLPIDRWISAAEEAAASVREEKDLQSAQDAPAAAPDPAPASSTVRAILIDVDRLEINEVEFDSEDWRAIPRLLRCDLFDIARGVGLKSRDSVAIDDEGLLKPGPVVQDAQGNPVEGPLRGFEINGRGFAGNGLIIGCDGSGGTITPQTGILDVALAVNWIEISRQ